MYSIRRKNCRHCAGYIDLAVISVLQLIDRREEHSEFIFHLVSISNDDGISVPKVDVVPKEMESLAKEAIDSCPVGAIYEEESNSAVEEKNAA